MSEVAGKSSLPSSNGKGSRRRRPTGKGPRAPKVDAEPSTGTPAEAAPKRERQEITPVPEELMGTKATGTVVVTIRNRKFNFGFISLAHGEKAEDITVPRVYYNPSYISEEGLNLYRGYEVAFEIAKDEENRTIAKGITLTEAGKAIKEERDAAAATKRAERAAEKAAAVAVAPAKKAEKAPDTTANGEEGAPKEGSKRRRRPRRRGDAKPAEEGEAAVEKPKKEPREPREPRAPRRSATFTITVEGDASKTGTLDYTISQSIGRLKSLAAKAVDASLDLSVYLVTAEAPRGVFLTRAVLNTVGETGTILLANKREEDNIPAAAATEEK